MRKYNILPIMIALITISFFQLAPSAAQAKGPFPDMPKEGASEIQSLYDDDILQGNPDGTLRPDDPVTRAEAFTLIGRALKLDGNKRATIFKDVPSTHYASGYIATGVEKGLVAGTTSTTFSPRDNVTRAQMAVFLTRAFNLSKTRPDVIYKDVSANTFGASAINMITTERISAGYPGGTFGPNKGTTRKEFSLFLARALYPQYKLAEYIPDEGLLEASATKAVVYNAGEGLNIRSTPDTNQAPIGKMKNGETVHYYATTGNWAIFTYQGKPAYVSLSYLKSPSTGGGSPGLSGKVIVVDPGHGGHDPGAVGFGLHEKDVVLAIGLKVKKKLEAAGATVVMTRSTDVFLELRDRAAIANNRNADAFISIHANAGPSSANGSETYWNSTHAGANSKKLAESIQREMIKKLKTRDRGAKQANFHVIKNSKMMSVLVEIGFISNKAEASKLGSSAFQDDAAAAIVQGVGNFYK